METVANLEELLTARSFGPAHSVCKANVALPTIRFGERHYYEKRVTGIYVQWFGDPTSDQFLFDVCSKVDDVHWMNDPEKFQVVFLGKVGDWPRREVAQKVADQVTEGKLDAWVIWVCSHHYHVRHSNGEGPGSFLTSIVLLGDPNVGVISPQKYVNLEALNCPHCKK